MLDERTLLDEGLDVDEAVVSKDRALSYLYFHVDKKVRQTVMDSFIANVGIKYGVRVNEVYGYDAIAGNTGGGAAIHSHPGFWMLMKHETDRNENFRIWTKNGLDARRGYQLMKRQAAAELSKTTGDSLRLVQEETMKEGLDQLVGDGIVNSEIADLKLKISESISVIEKHEATINDQAQIIEGLNATIEKQARTIDDQKTAVQTLTTEKQKVEITVKEQVNTIERQHQELERLRADPDRINKYQLAIDIEELQDQVKAKEAELKALQSRFDDQTKIIKEKDRALAAMAPLPGDALAVKQRIEALEKENAKLESQGREARKQNYALKEKLAERAPGPSHFVELCAVREQGHAALERLRAEKDSVIMELETKLRALAGTTEAGLRLELSGLKEANKTLSRQLNEYRQMASSPSAELYDSLVRVATLMGQVNRASDGVQGLELQNAVFRLVDLTLAGSGLAPSQLSAHRAPVYSGLFAAYSKAAQREQESYAQRVGGGSKAPKRQRN